MVELQVDHFYSGSEQEHSASLLSANREETYRLSCVEHIRSAVFIFQQNQWEQLVADLKKRMKWAGLQSVFPSLFLPIWLLTVAVKEVTEVAPVVEHICINSSASFLPPREYFSRSRSTAPVQEVDQLKLPQYMITASGCNF